MIFSVIFDVQVVRDVVVRPLLEELLESESQQGPKHSESFSRVSFAPPMEA